MVYCIQQGQCSYSDSTYYARNFIDAHMQFGALRFPNENGSYEGSDLGLQRISAMFTMETYKRVGGKEEVD